MSSPFAVFRRHQRVLLAVVGVMAMIAFVFLGNIANYGGRGEPTNPVLVETTHYGELHESDVYNLRENRRLVARFLAVIAEMVSFRETEQFQANPRIREMLRQQRVAQFQGILYRSTPPGDAAAVETFVLAKQAEAAGIVVTDQTVNDFLASVIGASITPNELKQVIADLGKGRYPVTEKGLFQALRLELLATNYASMFIEDMAAIPPGQRWDYFLRLNERATIEALPLAVANFVKDVPTPNEQDLKKLFKEHKEELPNPASPDPGFREPKKIAVQYVEANRDTFIHRAEEQVTDASIAEYYEKNKALHFRKALLPAESDAKKAENPAADSDEMKTPAADAKPADGQKPAAPAGSGTSEPAPATGATPAPSSPPVPAPTSPTPPKAKSPGKSAAVARRSAVRLVADEKPAPAAGATPKPAEKAASPPSSETHPTEKNAAGNGSPEKSAPDKSSPEKAGEKPADEASPADGAQPAATEGEVQYEPLEKVKDQIRTEIARQEAGKQIEQAMDELLAVMLQYSEDRVLDETPDEKVTGEKVTGEQKPAESKDRSKKTAAPAAAGPKPPDLAALAKKYGLEEHETGLMTAREAFDDLDIGRSIPEGARGGSATFISQAFSDQQSIYTPMRSGDIQRDFLYWKTRSEPEQTPTFERARPKVERAWKLIAARRLAEKKAEQCMTEAESAKMTLAELFGGDAKFRVLKPAPFSWFTLGVVPREGQDEQPRLGEVEGVEMPGEGFMRAVFQLAPGGFSVTSNQPRMTYYVVHLLSYDRPFDSLAAQFGTEDERKYMMLANFDKSRMFENWVREILNEAGVHWQRPPQVSNDF